MLAKLSDFSGGGRGLSWIVRPWILNDLKISHKLVNNCVNITQYLHG